MFICSRSEGQHHSRFRARSNLVHCRSSKPASPVVIAIWKRTSKISHQRYCPSCVDCTDNITSIQLRVEYSFHSSEILRPNFVLHFSSLIWSASSTPRYLYPPSFTFWITCASSKVIPLLSFSLPHCILITAHLSIPNCMPMSSLNTPTVYTCVCSSLPFL